MIANTNSPHTQKWAVALSQNGIEVNLFSIDPVQKELSWRRCLVSHFAPPTKDKFLPRKYLALYKQLKKVLIEVKPDILHAHYLSNYATLAALTGFKPFCVTAWGSDVYQYPKQNAVNALLLKWMLRKAGGIISTSEAMKQELLNYTSKNITVIPFGINFSDFAANVGAVDKTVIRIGIFKRLETVYGIDRAISAFAELIKQSANQKVELSIIGSGSQELALKELTQSLGITGLVTFIPWAEPEQIPALLQQQHICLYLSERESFGVALIEAMAAKKQLVVSDIPAFREVGKGYEGITYVQASKIEHIVNALQHRIKACLNEVDLPSNTQIYKRYELNETIQTQMEFYKSLIAKSYTK
jgi:glycosyltransferase involved in cell wall biosynthesis